MDQKIYRMGPCTDRQTMSGWQFGLLQGMGEDRGALRGNKGHLSQSKVHAARRQWTKYTLWGKIWSQLSPITKYYFFLGLKRGEETRWVNLTSQKERMPPPQVLGLVSKGQEVIYWERGYAWDESYLELNHYFSVSHLQEKIIWQVPLWLKAPKINHQKPFWWSDTAKNTCIAIGIEMSIQISV